MQLYGIVLYSVSISQALSLVTLGLARPFNGRLAAKLGAIEMAPFTAQSIGPIVAVCLQIFQSGTVPLVLKPVTNSNRFMGFAWCSPCL